DDGFQHRRLHRDMDVVLVSSIEPFGKRRLLPLGRLREPLEGLSRSDVLVITKAEHRDNESFSQLKTDLYKYNPDAPLFVSSHESASVSLGLAQHNSAEQGGGFNEPVDWLKGRKVFAFCAIAQPESFILSLKQAGAVIVGTKFFRDHYRFRRPDMELVSASAVSSGAHWIMTTEKDIMRLRALMEPPRNCVALSIEFRVDEGFYDHIFEFARETDA
ncbi:tetraacyldisaccharide 4'-kinase, partial [Nitrospirota bacterium]